jgi:16S rRNA (uracil1498-N3)-methyltransferase
MRIPRVFVDTPLESGQSVALPAEAIRHVAQVLRRRSGQALTLFDGRGGEFGAEIEQIRRGEVRVRIGAHAAIERESPLELTLGQGISRGERMDYTIQKAVELGVSAIVPLATARATVRLDAARGAARERHWRAVAAHACEQCGRNRVPATGPVQSLAEWLGQVEGRRLLLAAGAATELAGAIAGTDRIVLLAGPEGGFDAAEIDAARDAGFEPVRLGPRVLRTETAAIAALAVIQALSGDLADLKS